MDTENEIRRILKKHKLDTKKTVAEIRNAGIEIDNRIRMRVANAKRKMADEASGLAQSSRLVCLYSTVERALEEIESVEPSAVSKPDIDSRLRKTIDFYVDFKHDRKNAIKKVRDRKSRRDSEDIEETKRYIESNLRR